MLTPSDEGSLRCSLSVYLYSMFSKPITPVYIKLFFSQRILKFNNRAFSYCKSLLVFSVLLSRVSIAEVGSCFKMKSSCTY